MEKTSFFDWIDSNDDQYFLKKIDDHVRTGQVSWEPLFAESRIDRTRAALVHLKKITETQLRELNAKADAFHSECFRRGYAGKQEWFSARINFDAEKTCCFHIKLQLIPYSFV